MPRGLGGEVGWWCPSLNDSANDLSGNGNNGTYNGGMGTTSDTGAGGTKAYLFDGTNDAISLTSDVAISTGWTVALWVKRNGTPATSVLGFAKRDSQRVYIGLNADNTPYIRAGTDSGSLSSTAFSDLTWYHMVLRINNSTTYEGFINGVSIGTRSTTLTTSTGTGIGAYFSNQTTPLNSYWKGSLDDIRIFSRVLTQAEINFLYNNGYGRGRQRTLPATAMAIGV